jgi:hypothetical protein
LRALQPQKRRLEKKIDHERLIVTALPELSLQILNAAKERGRVSNADVFALTGANRNTVKKHLAALVAATHLTQHGAGKGTWYEASETAQERSRKPLPTEIKATQKIRGAFSGPSGQGCPDGAGAALKNLVASDQKDPPNWRPGWRAPNPRVAASSPFPNKTAKACAPPTPWRAPFSRRSNAAPKKPASSQTRHPSNT